MILTLTIAIIIWLALTCVYFINESRETHEALDSALWWEKRFFENSKKLEAELHKYKRPRDSKGRFR